MIDDIGESFDEEIAIQDGYESRRAQQEAILREHKAAQERKRLDELEPEMGWMAWARCLERDISTLRTASTNDQRRIAQLEGDLQARKQYSASMENVNEGLRRENRRLRRCLRDVIALYSEEEDDDE